MNTNMARSEVVNPLRESSVWIAEAQRERKFKHENEVVESEVDRSMEAVYAQN